jgi:F-type H+-transporting ATPase subunit b
MADLSLIVLAEAASEAAEPSALGLTPPMWVALSMLVLIVVMLWLKVPGVLTKGLDASIAEIRKQLDEAKALRADAEALKAEYANRIANAEKDVAAMMAHAQTEANGIIAKAESDTTDVIGRREKMASDKIEAAERGAISDLRNKAAHAATVAATGLIASHYGADADKVQVDSAIAGI